MNEEKRKKKLEEKRIKEINNSLRFFSGTAQKDFGVLAIQEEDNVFFCGESLYKKIYMVKPGILGNKRKAFMSALLSSFDNQMRLTMCLKNREHKLSSYMFLTVSYSADTYYEAKAIIKEFEESLSSEITKYLNIQITACDLESLLSYMYLNATGIMKQINTSNLFAKKNSSIFDVQKKDHLYFVCKDRYGFVLNGKYYSENAADISKVFYDTEGSFLITVDFKRYSKNEKELFQYDFNQTYKFNSFEIEQEIVNVGYHVAGTADDENKCIQLKDKLTDFYNSKNILLMPSSERMDDMFSNCCMFGLKDLHSMQNSNVQLLSELLI